MRARILVPSSLAIAACLALGACGRSDQQAAAPPAPAADASAPAPAASDAAPSPAAPAAGAEAPAAAAAPAPAAAPAAAIASADGEKTGLRVEVTELKRGSGDTLSLKFTFINDTDEPFSIHSNYLGQSNMSVDYDSVGGIHLVDPVGKKKYMVVRDSEKLCVCSNSVKPMPAHSRTNLWARYPAPPAGTNVVSIVVPHFTPMDDVPIAQ